MKLLNTLGTALVLIVAPAYLSALPWDIDSDGFINDEDKDIDGDGIPNGIEDQYGLDSYRAVDAGWDMDGDGWTNEEEFRFVSAMDDPNDNPDTQSSLLMQRIFPAFDAEYDDYQEYGLEVVIDGDTVAVGDHYAHNNRRRTHEMGSIQLYSLENGLWQPGQVLIPSVEYAGDYGRVLDLQGDILVAGAERIEYSGETIHPGDVYVYTRIGNYWYEEAHLTPPGKNHTHSYGSAVALSGDQLLVACRHCDDAEGRVFVYERDEGNWTQTQLISNCAVGDKCVFGSYLAVDGDQALITGSQLANGYQADITTYVYKRADGVWELEAELPSRTLDVARQYRTMDISGDTILIRESAYDANDVFTSATYEYVKKDGVWTEQSVFYQANYNAPVIGSEVAIVGDRALMSGGVNGTSQRFVVEFQRTEGVWTEASRMYGDADDYDGFGYGLNLEQSGEQAVIGAYDAPDTQGAVYILDYSQPR